MNTEISSASAPTAQCSSNGTFFSDRQIAEALGYFGAEPFIEERYGSAARRIFATTQRWPWELVAGFPPKCWNTLLIGKLAAALDNMVKTSAKVDHDVEIDNFIAFMRERARQRDKEGPTLSCFDIRGAEEHFNTKARDCAPGRNGNKEGESRKRGNPTDFPPSGSTGKRKCAHESSDDSQTKKSARRDEPANPEGSTPGNPATTKTPAENLIDLIQRVQHETGHPFRMMDLRNIDRLKASARKKLNDSTREWRDAHVSMKERESQLAEVLTCTATPRNREELRQTLVNKIEAKKTAEQAKALFDQHKNDMALGPDLIFQATQQHEAKLRECDEGIAQAEADIQHLESESSVNEQQVQKMRRQLKKKQSEVRLLGDSKEHYTQELDYYRMIEGLVKLGPQGLAALTRILTKKGI